MLLYNMNENAGHRMACEDLMDFKLLTDFNFSCCGLGGLNGLLKRLVYPSQ